MLVLQEKSNIACKCAVNQYVRGRSITVPLFLLKNVHIKGDILMFINAYGAHAGDKPLESMQIARRARVCMMCKLTFITVACAIPIFI